MVRFSSSMTPSVTLPLGSRPWRAATAYGAGSSGLERQLLQLVLDLAHAQPVGDRRVDVERLLGDPGATLLGQMIERPHVVEPIRELHHDDADVVHHRQQHLAEVLRLTLLARREGDGTDLGDALDDVRDLRPEQLLDALDGGERVFDDVVQQPGGDGDDVEPHVGEDVGDLERMHEVRLAGVAHLSLVLERREDVGPAQQLEVGVRAYRPHFVEQILESNHRGGVKGPGPVSGDGPAASNRSGTVPWSPQRWLAAGRSRRVPNYLGFCVLDLPGAGHYTGRVSASTRTVWKPSA